MHWNIVKRKRKIITIAVGLSVLWLILVFSRIVFSRVDYQRVQRGAAPMFAWEEAYLSDGGTVIYQGIGYELTAQHRFHVENGEPIGYDSGPILQYQLNWLLLPLTDKQDIRFVPRKICDHATTEVNPLFPPGKGAAVANGLTVQFDIAVNVLQIQMKHFQVVEHKHAHDITDLFDLSIDDRNNRAILIFKKGTGDFGTGNAITVTLKPGLPLRSGQCLKKGVKITCPTDR